MSKLNESQKSELIASIDYRIENFKESGTEGGRCPLCGKYYMGCAICPADNRYNGVLDICEEYDIIVEGSVSDIIADLIRLRRNVKRWKVVE